jgi:hypothetical protein
MLGRMLGQRLGSLQGGLVLLSDGPGEENVSTWRRGAGKVTIVVADLVDVEVGSFKDFEKTSFAEMT